MAEKSIENQYVAQITELKSQLSNLENQKEQEKTALQEQAKLAQTMAVQKKRWS
ncbi:hypothetical protein SCLARK_001766 [Spiroplasma clarkii]|uniref:hypothetical protein n=1 Tax=Spiroplasma clarkii TaxID=2139 RepID=UPI000B562D34|nr:hypothetical protein [Spiroplasma clarkii]ARU92219.1 hypothetical protein SCLARK_001766 [Spiroplasma clarkii]